MRCTFQVTGAAHLTWLTVAFDLTLEICSYKLLCSGAGKPTHYCFILEYGINPLMDSLGCPARPIAGFSWSASFNIGRVDSASYPMFQCSILLPHGLFIPGFCIFLCSSAYFIALLILILVFRHIISNTFQVQIPKCLLIKNKP